MIYRLFRPTRLFSSPSFPLSMTLCTALMGTSSGVTTRKPTFTERETRHEARPHRVFHFSSPNFPYKCTLTCQKTRSSLRVAREKGIGFSDTTRRRVSVEFSKRIFQSRCCEISAYHSECKTPKRLVSRKEEISRRLK